MPTIQEDVAEDKEADLDSSITTDNNAYYTAIVKSIPKVKEFTKYLQTERHYTNLACCGHFRSSELLLEDKRTLQKLGVRNVRRYHLLLRYKDFLEKLREDQNGLWDKINNSYLRLYYTQFINQELTEYRTGFVRQEHDEIDIGFESACLMTLLGCENTPNVPLNIYQQTMAVISEVNRLKDQSNTSFLREVLQQTTQLLLQPNDANIASYKKIAKRADGATLTYGRALSGLMLTLVGLVTVAVAVFAAVASFGVSTPLSAMGIALGISAVVKGICIAGSVIGGGYMTYRGMGLFGRTGLSKNMTNLVKAKEAELATPKKALNCRSR